MNKRDKSKDEGKSDSKKAIGIILTAIMLISVFAVFLAMAVPGDITKPSVGECVRGTYNFTWDPFNTSNQTKTDFYKPVGANGGWGVEYDISSGYGWRGIDTTTWTDMSGYRFRIRDYGNSSNETIHNFTIDNTPPTIAVNLPKNCTWWENNTCYEINVTTNDTLCGVCNVTVNVSVINASTGTLNLTNTTLADPAGGFYWNGTVCTNNATNKTNFTVTAKDCATDENGVNNTANATFRIGVDDTDPNVTVISPPADKWVNNGTNLTLEANVTDDRSGVHNVTVNVSCVNETADVVNLTGPDGNGNYTGYVHVNTSNEGPCNLNITAYDNTETNNDSSVNFTVYVENIKPEVYPISPNSTMWNKTCNYITLNVSVYDPGTAWVNKSGILNVTVNVSEINTSASIELSNTSIANASGGYYWNATVHIDTGISSGLKNLSITAYDNATNYNDTEQLQIRIDNDAPVIEPVPPQFLGYEKNGTMLTLNVSVSDLSGSGVKNVTVEIPTFVNETIGVVILDLTSGGSYDGYWANTTLINTTQHNPGNVTLNITAYDNVSNSSTSNFTVFVDNLEPNITTKTASQNSVKNCTNLTLSVTVKDMEDPDEINCSGIVSVKVNVTKLNASYTEWLVLTREDGTIYNGTWNGTVHVTNITDCDDVILEINATDKSGNSNISEDFTIKIDNVEPTVDLEDSTPWQYVTNCTDLNLSVDACDTCSLIKEVIVNASVLNESAGDAGNVTLTHVSGCIYNETVHVNTTNTGGNFTLRIYAYDWAGNVDSKHDLTFYIDNTEPSVTANAPTGEWVNNCTTITLNATVTDGDGESGVNNVTVNVSAINSTQDNVTLNLAGGYWTGKVHVNTSNLGLQNLTITAYDNVGNVNNSVNMTVRVDNAIPSVIANAPTGEWVNNGTTLRLNASITDALSGVKNATVDVSSVNSTIGTAILNNVSGYWINDTVIVDTSNEGLQNLTIIAYDNASNVNDSVNMTVKVDNVIPAVTAIAPIDLCVKNCTDVTLNATVTDAFSGVYNVSVDVSAINATQGTVNLTRVGVTNYWNGTVHVETSNSELLNLTITAYDNASNVNNSVNMTVKVDNIPPVAEAGPDQLNVAVNETLTFNASGSYDNYSCCNITYSWDFGDGNNTTGVEVTHAYNTTGNYTVTLNVTDCVGNNGTDTLLVSVTQELFDIPLLTGGSGWNLVSTPLMPLNNSIENVTANIDANLTAVWAYRYNSTSGSMEWLVYTPGEGFDTLNYFDAGWGYWVSVTSDDTLTIRGTFFPPPPAIPPTYDVYTGWNLIGFHSQTDKNASIYLVNLGNDWSTLYKYPFGGPYDQILANENMERGYGYWLSMKANGTIAP